MAECVILKHIFNLNINVVSFVYDLFVKRFTRLLTDCPISRERVLEYDLNRYHCLITCFSRGSDLGLFSSSRRLFQHSRISLSVSGVLCFQPPRCIGSNCATVPSDSNLSPASVSSWLNCNAWAHNPSGTESSCRVRDLRLARPRALVPDLNRKRLFTSSFSTSWGLSMWLWSRLEMPQLSSSNLDPEDVLGGRSDAVGPARPRPVQSPAPETPAVLHLPVRCLFACPANWVF